MGNDILLAGDIGGTNVRLARVNVSDDHIELEAIKTYPSRRYDHFTDVLREYLGSDIGNVGSAAFGIAGPVTGSVIKATNLPWRIDADDLSNAMEGTLVTLVNDLVAMGYGVNQLTEKDCLVLREGNTEGDDDSGNACLLAAGTGLGMSVLRRTSTGWEPQASEGGHSGLSPRSEDEMRLARYLLERFGACYWELAVSGPGLSNLFDFVSAESGTSSQLDATPYGGDRSAAITELALEGEHDLAGRAINLFVGLYASAARNLALIALATGGVFIGGGIAPKLFPRFTEEHHEIFRSAFIDAPAYRNLLARIPVTVITDELTGLKGAGLLAARNA